jgi:subtilisin family serine protease
MIKRTTPRIVVAVIFLSLCAGIAFWQFWQFSSAHRAKANGLGNPRTEVSASRGRALRTQESAPDGVTSHLPPLAKNARITPAPSSIPAGATTAQAFVPGPLSRRLPKSRVLETKEIRSSNDHQFSMQHLVESEGKFRHLVVEQSFMRPTAGAPAVFLQETAYVADAILLRPDDPRVMDLLVASGEIRDYRKIGRKTYRAQLPRPTLAGVTTAKTRIESRIPKGVVVEPDFLLQTFDESEQITSRDYDGDGVIDEEFAGSMSVPLSTTSPPTLSPELILKDAQERVADLPLGARVLTFDKPLSDLRSQVFYRPYVLEQNFVLVAGPSQNSGVYPQNAYASGYPSNGTIYVRSLSGDAGMQIRHKDGLPFSIYQIDLSEYSTAYTGGSVTFVGSRKDGTSISQTFTLDGIIDGTGPLADFQTFSFPAGFSNLDHLTITTQGFMMDNLVVSPLGEETPLPPPPALPVLYDITWEGFPHVVGEVTAVTGPYAPSTINFGYPRVRSQIGAMVGPALELRGTGSTYEQFACLLERGGKSYTLDFDMTMPSGGLLALLIDRSSGFSRADFNSDGTITSTFGLAGSFVPAAVTHFRFEVDLVNGLCRVLKNGTQIHSGGFPIVGGDVKNFRLSATVSTTEAIGIDNIRITGDVTDTPIPPGPFAVVAPQHLVFPTISSGMEVTREIYVENAGSAPLLIDNVRTDSPEFRTSPTVNFSLLPGQNANISVTYAPHAPGTHDGHLSFNTNEGGGTSKSVLLSGTATGIPTINLTPTTLHITMLESDVGTEFFKIHNTGSDTLQWRFVTRPPATPGLPVIPNDARFNSLWSMRSPSASTGGIDAVRAWRIASDARSIRVAVIDTGVDYTHPDLSGNIFQNPDEVPGNGVDDDHNGFIDDIRGWNFFSDNAQPMDDHGHGTHVAGTIGASGQNGIGVCGVVWGASIVPVKFLGPQGFGYTSDAIAAVEYARSMGCRVVNASWGGGSYSTLLRDTIEDFTVSNDALFVAAAGNSFQNTDIQPSFPACYNVAGIISVAASDAGDGLATFSNWGSDSVDLAAPGVSILSCLPNNSYGVASGTSMAAPHVSGSAALLLGYHPTLTGAECFQRLTSNADHPARLSDKVRQGSRLNVYLAISSSVSPWIQPTVWSGSVAASNFFTVPLNVDTHGMPPGEYTTSLALETNDPAQPLAEISVILKVRKRNNLNEWSMQQFAVNNLLFEANAFDTWLGSADPDHDGNSNLLEFLTGTDPENGSVLPVTPYLDSANGRSFRFQTRADLSGVTYRVEWSSNLAVGDWQTTGMQIRLLPSSPDPAIQLWEATVPGAAAMPNLFFRIVASEN